MNIAPILNKLVGGVLWITSDIIRFVIAMIIIFIFFFIFVMKKGLNLDDKLHKNLVELYAALFIYGLMLMADSGAIDTFIASIS